MGVDIHGFNLVRLLVSSAPLGRVATLGRQELSLEAMVRRKLGISDSERFCEELLISLGANTVHSYDVSDYEGATHIADLNEINKFSEVYDTVLDFGTLEHVWNQPVAFQNVVSLAKKGGRICHVLPANNLSGHGLWQYSSDLLYQIYSKENGFGSTEVYYASAVDPSYWFKTPASIPGERVELASVEPIQLLCVTQKLVDNVRVFRVHQPFYQYSAATTGDAKVSSPVSIRGGKIVRRYFSKVIPRGSFPFSQVRNIVHLISLVFGSRKFSLNSTAAYRRIRVERLLSAPSDVEDNGHMNIT